MLFSTSTWAALTYSAICVLMLNLTLRLSMHYSVEALNCSAGVQLPSLCWQ